MFPHWSILLQITAALFLFPSIGLGGAWHGKVVWVPDGDTIYVLRLSNTQGKVKLGQKKMAIQLDGVDAPEPKMPFGKKATAFTKRLVLGKVVRVVSKKKDRYGRIIADIFIGQVNLNHALIEAGLAWHYKRYNRSKQLAALQRKAKRKKKGLWRQKKAISPWIWRRKHAKRRKRTRKAKKGTKQQKQSGVYHGNTRSKIFHAPTCRYYNCRTCTAPLRNPRIAKKKGFRAHKSCVRKYLKNLPKKK